MIQIINITDEPTESGPNKYVIKINQEFICTFTHNREDGLSECLFRGAMAVRMEEMFIE